MSIQVQRFAEKDVHTRPFPTYTALRERFKVPLGRSFSKQKHIAHTKNAEQHTVAHNSKQQYTAAQSNTLQHRVTHSITQ